MPPAVKKQKTAGRPPSVGSQRGAGSSSSDASTVVVPADASDDDRSDCEAPVSAREQEYRLCEQRRPPPRKIHAPPPRPGSPSDSEDELSPAQPLLSDAPTATPEESYGEDEASLNAFTKLHSICSAEATASNTLQTLGSLCSRQMIKTHTLEKISKTYDDSYLRPPNAQVGERPCVCGSRCVARVVAKMRYGPRTKYPFVMTEFLTPLERATFEKGGGLPARKGKCLLCIRYFTNYVYLLAKQDPQFLADAQNFDLQLFENCLALPIGSSAEDIGKEINRQPHAASVVEAQHGYRRSVLLFADESFVDTCAGRGSLASLAWRPVVRFKSNDYRYELNDNGEPRIVQVGMGVDYVEETRGISHFRVNRTTPSARRCPFDAAVRVYVAAAPCRGSRSGKGRKGGDDVPRVSISSIRSLHQSFEHAGVFAALERAHASALAKQAHEPLCAVPAWTVFLPFEDAAARLACCSGSKLSRWLARARQSACLCDGVAFVAPTIDSVFPAWASEVDASNDANRPVSARIPGARVALAALRLSVGHALERMLARTGKCSPRELSDSLCVAAWTSAHADFLDARRVGIIEPVAPNLHSSPSALNEIDLAQHFERRSQSGGVSKQASSLAQLLVRAISLTSRGWEAALSAAIKASPGTRAICTRALISSVTGLHACVPPSKRPSWPHRLALKRILMMEFGSRLSSSARTTKDPAVVCSVAVKEALRRSLAQSLACSEPVRDGLVCFESWVATLELPPHRPPSASLHASSIAFVAVARQLVDRKQQAAPLLQQKLAHCAEQPGNGRRTTLRPPLPQTTVGATVALSEESFRANFAPLWMLMHVHGHRLARLGPTMQRVLTERDVVRRLCASLEDGEALRVQRLAFATPSAALLPVSCVERLLRLAPSGSPSAFGASSGRSGHDAAMIARFSTAARLAEAVQCVDLGPRTWFAQARALLRRNLRHGELDEALSQPDEAGRLHRLREAVRTVPEVLRSIVVCSECKRVANAHVDTSPNVVGPINFNEIGISSSMAYHVPDPGRAPIEYYCAHRASASIRTAAQTEKTIEAVRPEQLSLEEVEAAMSHQLPQAAAARLRRDTRICMVQRHTQSCCGKQPMARIDALGRAVRVMDGWWVLCSLCGVLMRWSPGAFFGDEPCCGRCDTSLVHPHKLLLPFEQQRLLCRFCGKASDSGGGAAHRLYRAPHDVSGKNTTLPPPLRRVAFCAAHQRTWLAAGLKQLKSSVVLSHIAHSAKPVLVAATRAASGGPTPPAVNAAANAADGPAPSGRKRSRKSPRRLRRKGSTA